MDVHELKGRAGMRVFSDFDFCLSESYTNRLPAGEMKTVEGGGEREMVLCERQLQPRPVRAVGWKR